MEILFVLLCLFFFTAILIFITHQIVKKRFYRVVYPDHATAEKFYCDYRDRYSRTSVSFFSGKNRLQGYIYPATDPKGLLVFAHGIGAGHENYLRELLWMVDHGWTVFAYNATGTWESEGDGTRGLVQSALDLDAALSYIESQEEFSHLPVCLLGHSWGGYAVTAGLWFSHRVTASVSICGYAHPLEMMIEFAKAYIGKGLALLAPFVWVEQKITFGKYASLSAPDGINRADIPVLLIHASEDEVVSIDGASIVAHKDEIKSKHTQIFISDAKGQAGHGSVFYHKESVPYIEEVNREFESVLKEHGGKPARAIREAFFKNVDKERYNRPNDELLSKINAFFEDAIQHGKT